MYFRHGNYTTFGRTWIDVPHDKEGNQKACKQQNNQKDCLQNL